MKNFYNNLKNGLTSVRVGNTLDSILSRFCLASLILMTIGVDNVLGEDCKYNLNDEVLTSYTEKSNSWRVPSFYLGYVENEYGISHIQVTGSFPDLWKYSAAQHKFKLQYKIGENGTLTDVSGASDVKVYRSVTDIYNSSVSIAATPGQRVYFYLLTSDGGITRFSDRQRFVATVAIRMTKTLPASVAEINFGDVTIGNSPDSTRSITYSCEATGKTMSVSRTSGSTDFSASVDNSGNLDCSGTRTVTVTFSPTSEGSKSATFTVSSNNGASSVSFSVSGTGKSVVKPVYKWNGSETTTFTIGDSYLVGGSSVDLSTLWTSSSSATKTYSKLSFTPSGSNNTGATEPALVGSTLSLGQAGTVRLRVSQPATTGYYAGADTIDLVINKRANTLACSWGAWSKTVEYYSETSVPFTSDNDAVAPIVVTPSPASSVATYDEMNHKFVANYREGQAVWTVTQAEDYKYQAAVAQNCTINVGTIDCPECYVFAPRAFENDTTFSKVDTKVSWLESGATDTLFFEMKKNGGGGQGKVYRRYSSGWTRDTVVYEGDKSWALRKIALDKATTGVKFAKSGAIGTDDPYIKNVRVTRKKWFKIKNAVGDAEITTLAMPVRTLTGDSTEMTFKVDYSTCASTIKVVSNNPHIVVKAADRSFSSTTNGVRTITLKYSSTEAETISDAIITIYTPYEHKTLTVSAQTQAKLSTHLVYKGAASYAVNADNIAVADLFEVRDQNNDVVSGATITLSAAANEIFDLANSNTELDPKCGGSATITASYVGDVTHEAASDLAQVITINRLDDEVSFEHGKAVLVTGDEFDLEGWASALSGTDITYTTASTTVISVEDGKVKAIGKGTATLTATSAGDCTYNSGIAKLTIKVRNASDPCETALLYKSSKHNINLYSGTQTYTIKEGPQDKLTFKVWKTSSVATYSADVKILDNTDNVLHTYTYSVGDLSTTEPETPNVEIDITQYPTARKISISGSGTLYKYISELRVSQKAYLTASTSSVTMSTVKACETATGQFNISYSDLSTLHLTQTNENFSYEVWNGETKLDGFDNDCGDYGTYTVKFFYTPQVVGPYSNEVTISASGKSQTIVLNGTANKPDRTIVWDILSGNVISATQSVDLAAYAETSCLSPAGGVYYTYSSATEGAATIDGSKITFHKAATVTVTAHTSSSELYNDAPTVDKVWTVSKVGIVMEKKPTITSIITCGDLSTAVTYNSNDFKAVSALDNTVVIPGTIAYAGPGNFNHAGLTDITFNFTPTDLSVYEATPFTVQVDVQHIASNATPSAEAITYGAAISSSTLSNSGTTAGTWTWNTADNSAILDAGEHTLNVHFTPENSNYSELDATVTLTVNKADAGVTPAAVEFTYGGKASNQTLSTATGSLAGTWSWTDSQKDATLAAGNYEMDVRFTPTDADNYNVLDTKVTVTVNKANAGVTPAAVEFTYGGKASDQTLSTATGSLAGTWSWIDAQKDATLAAGNYEMNVRFTPMDADNYNVLDTKVTVTVNKANAGVTPAAVEFTYGGKASDQTLSTATGSLAGTWSWTDSQKDATLAAGNYEMDVRFTPTDADNYNVLDTKVTVTVNKAATSLNWTNAPEDLAYNATGVTYTASSASDGVITYSITAGGAYAHIDSESGVLTIDEPGHQITIQASQAASTNYNAASPITVDVTIAAAPAAPTFTNATNNNDWQTAGNWSNGEVPSGENPNVIISGELIINEDVTVGGLTILPTGSVAVVTNGTLTIKGTSESRSEYGNLFVANGGEVDVNGTLHVGDLTVEASIGTENGSAESGQIAQAEHIAYANAYIEINMVPDGGPMDDSKWYGFTVPFAVNAYTGIAHKEGNNYVNCNYGSDIIIAEYDAIKRLNSGNGWKYISSPTLNPGQFYFFGADGGYNTFRFKASASSYTPAAAASLSVNGSTTNPHANWNGVGNSMLQHATASYAGGSYVQVYKNGLDAYEAVPTGSATFVVGCPFFVQATEATTLVLNVQNEVTAKYYAPSRVDNVEKVACVQLASVDGGYADHVYVSATDKEQNAYMMGHDLSKAGISAIVPQLWVNQYNQQLCVHEAALQGNNAACALGIYAPKSGDYLLSVAQTDNAEIYLTMNGQPIWNLSQSEYLLSLNKGTNDSYGLMMVNAPQVTTGVDEVATDNAQVSKIILNNQLYIIKNGQVFDATGKKVQ